MKKCDVFETNVFGAMRVTRAVLPHMRNMGAGCIINVTSMAGIIGLAAETALFGKFAAEGLPSRYIGSASRSALRWGRLLLACIAPHLLRNVDDEAMEQGDPPDCSCQQESADDAGGSTPRSARGGYWDFYLRYSRYTITQSGRLRCRDDNIDDVGADAAEFLDKLRR